MPYFFIFPAYLLLFIGLLAVSLVFWFIRELRRWSSYIFWGALGTLPGFILGNVLFWLVAWGLLTLGQKSAPEISSDIAKGVATATVIIAFVGGLVIANVGGCVVGFCGGLWLRALFRKRKAG